MRAPRDVTIKPAGRSMFMHLLLAFLVLFTLVGSGGANAQAWREEEAIRMPPPEEEPEPEPVNSAVFVSQVVPATMQAGALYNVSVSMRNDGGTTWSAGTAYRLGSQNPQDNSVWGGGRVELPSNIAPGQTAVFNFQVRAPQASGLTNFQWRMLRDGYQWFGAYSTNVAVNVAAVAAVSSIDGAAVAAVNVPAKMMTGQTYQITIVMQNTGNTTWMPGVHTLGSRNPTDNLIWGPGRVAIATPVAPGQQYTFSFPVTAPAAGDYLMQWGVLSQVQWFGALASAAVNVSPFSSIDDAAVAAVTVPARMITGQTYPVTIVMQNTGNTTWMPGVHTLGSRNPTDNLIWGPGRVAIATPVAPGQQYTFSFPVTAPAAGDYLMQWGVLSQVQWFGALASSAVTVTENMTGVTFIHTDGLGSPVARTDGAGTVLSRTRYEPYGYVATGATPTIGFTGHVNDADTGLTYMQQRYYDPVAGRFLSVDPVVTDANNAGSFNRYAYANNSPYRFIDPDGRQAAERFVEQHRKDMESPDKGKVYEPLQPIAVAIGGGALVVSAAALGPVMVAAVHETLAPVVVPLAVKELTKQELKSVRSLARQMEKHQQKLEDFRANPTVRPGMENLSQAKIKEQQAQRVKDIEVEIQKNFVDKIMQIIGN